MAPNQFGPAPLLVALLATASRAASVPAAAESTHGQVLVLGAHHTATSIVAKSLSLLGLYVGEPDELLLSPANPLKFWERRDVIDANQLRLRAGTPTANHSKLLPEWVGYGFDGTHGARLDVAKAREAIAKLEAGAAKVASRRGDGSPSSWAIKDPRLSLLASEWLPLMREDAVCVLTVRHPLEFANSMMEYSSSLGLSHWNRVWQHYMTSALRS